MRVIQLARQTV